MKNKSRRGRRFLLCLSLLRKSEEVSESKVKYRKAPVRDA